MERFRADGHLADEALTALALGENLDELARLEIAEHLAYCDDCLQRYTDLLAEEVLLVPAHSCRESLRHRIRTRTLRLLTSRYATAAAAVALAVTMVWSDLPTPDFPMEPSPLVQRAGDALTQWGEALDHTFSAFSGFFDEFGGRTA